MISRLLLALGALLLIGAAEPPTQPKPLPAAEAAMQGRAIVAEMLSRKPAQNVTNTGVLKVRDAKGRRAETPVTFRIFATGTNWWSVYETQRATNSAGAVTLTVRHTENQPNVYLLENRDRKTLSGNEAMIPFAGSDFWAADLGLEFLHWPGQRLLRKEIRRGQSCNVLESVNPHPAPGAYARVLSWIDIDTGGIINADAYDTEGKPLKEYAAKSFKKVRGEWELQEIQIENRQTGSRTWIDFDLARK